MSRRTITPLQVYRADYVRDRARAALRILCQLDTCTDADLAGLVCEAIGQLRAAEDEVLWLELAP